MLTIEAATTTTEPIEFKMSLNLFLDFLTLFEREYIEQESQEHLDKEGLNLFINFKNLITDLNLCAISGGAILDYRLKREPTANDLDFFIEGNSENIDIIADFFKYSNHMKLFKKFQTDILPQTKNIVYTNGFYENTSYEDYNFIKRDIKLSTSRFSFGPKECGGFQLNFIFIKKLTKQEAKLLNLRASERTHSGLYQDAYIYEIVDPNDENKTVTVFNNSRISSSDFLKKNSFFLELQQVLKIFPKGIPIHHIDSSFDFEELKYVYSFEKQQVLNIYEAGKYLLEDFGNKLALLEKSKFKSRLLVKTKQYVERLEKRNEEFKQEFSDPKVVNITFCGLTPHIHRQLQNINNRQIRYNEDLETTFQNLGIQDLNFLTENIIRSYNNIIIRIPKYTEKGFNINDPKKVIANMEFFMSLYYSYVINKSFLKNIALKSCLLSGKNTDVKKAQVIRSFSKNIDEFNKENSLVLKRPPKSKSQNSNRLTAAEKGVLGLLDSR